MNLPGVVNSIKSLLNTSKPVSQSLPAFLLFNTTMRRPGMSAIDITSNIIQDYGEIGIPTGANPDGSPNLINAYTYIVTKNIVKSIKQNGVGEGAMEPGTIVFQGDGGNAGGPVHVIGTNTNWPKVKIRFS